MNKQHLIIVCVTASLFGIFLLLALGSAGGVIAQGPARGPDPMISGQVGDLAVQGQQQSSGINAPNITTPPSYFNALGMNFVPSDSTVTAAYGNPGCLYKTGGPHGLTAPVFVPPGSVLKGIRVYFIDNDPADMIVFLTAYGDGTGFSNLTSVATSGASSSVRYADSVEITHTVDYSSNGYTMVAQLGALSSTMQLCGVRVAYIPPSIFGAALPLVVR